MDVLDQRLRLVLREHRDLADAGVHAVRQHEIDDAELAAERRRRFARCSVRPLSRSPRPPAMMTASVCRVIAADVATHRYLSLHLRGPALLGARERWSFLHVRSSRIPCSRIDPDRHVSRPRGCDRRCLKGEPSALWKTPRARFLVPVREWPNDRTNPNAALAGCSCACSRASSPAKSMHRRRRRSQSGPATCCGEMPAVRQRLSARAAFRRTEHRAELGQRRDRMHRRRASDRWRHPHAVQPARGPGQAGAGVRHRAAAPKASRRATCR